MRSFKDFLQKDTATQKKVVDEKTIFFLFQKEIQNRYGERGREMILPFSFREAILGIKTKSPLWANEVWLAREGIVSALNQAVGDEVIKTIKLYH